jgi:transcription elongation factor Elf1
MSTKESALKRTVSAIKKAMEPRRYGVHGKPFVCQLCGHDQFNFGSGASILGLYTLACADCGHLECFATQQPILADDAA